MAHLSPSMGCDATQHIAPKLKHIPKPIVITCHAWGDQTKTNHTYDDVDDHAIRCVVVHDNDDDDDVIQTFREKSSIPNILYVKNMSCIQSQSPIAAVYDFHLWGRLG